MSEPLRYILVGTGGFGGYWCRDVLPRLAEMFCDWLTGRRDDHPTHLDDNIHCCALLFAAVESAHTGQIVDVPEFPARNLALIPG